MGDQPFVPDEMSGQLFKNHKRDEQKEGAPHAVGTAKINGVIYRMSAWTNEHKSGKLQGQKYQSIKFSKQEDRPQQPKAEADDSGIPF